MKISILHVGKTSSKNLQLFIDEFMKRSGRFAQIQLESIDSIKGKKLSPSEVKKAECSRIISKTELSDTIVLLDEGGKVMDSRSFAGYISNHFMHRSSRLVFVIGGAYGFDEVLYKRASTKLSLSKMTFNHELALAVFSEQIYRALTIINGHPYHND